MSDDATLDNYTQNSTSVENNKRQVGPLIIELPEDWALTELEKMVSDITEIDHKMPNKTESGIPFVAAGDITSAGRLDLQDAEKVSKEAWQRLSTKFNPDRDDILYTRFGTIGHAERIDFDKNFLASYSVALIKTQQNKETDPEFLTQSLNWSFLQKQADMRTRGSANKNLNLGEIPKLVVPSPQLSEQRKIATVLHTVDQAIQKTEEIVEQAHTLKKSLMQDIFHGYHKDFTDYHTTPVGEIPIDWSVASIGDVVHTAQYGISESMSEEGQYPIFRMNNIENGYMIDEPLKYIDLDDDEFEKYRVEEGDILFNRTNSLKLVGKTGIYQLDGDHVFASYLVRLQTNDRAEPYYLNYYMNSSEAQNRMMDFATKGVSQANINANSIQQVKIPLPPIEEQKEIVGHIRSIDSQIESNKHYLSQLKQTKNGLMQDLLSGEVRTTDVDINIIEEIAQHG